jgi:23S rRNA (cytosine1962-C5)-methyltransferase
VVLDPPAFVKRRKDIRAGLRGYARINRLALRLLSRDGLLVSCSCSSYLQREQLTATILAGARHLDRWAQILEYGGQGADHPVHPAIPETDYLKACFARILTA